MIQHDDLIRADQIQRLIITIRSVQVMLDRDLAAVYGEETKVLNQAVKRNIDRFPIISDFRSATKKKPNWSQSATGSNP
jgi:hypothetical protein